MKKGILKIALVGCLTLVFYACESEDQVDELNVNVAGKSMDPHEVDPDCGNPDEC